MRALPMTSRVSFEVSTLCRWPPSLGGPSAKNKTLRTSRHRGCSNLDLNLPLNSALFLEIGFIWHYEMSLYNLLPLPCDGSAIRLLRLKASDKPHSPIYGNLTVVRLNRETRYEALSYFWGDANTTENIFVNGEIIAITTNLAAALRALRHPQHDRTLWIDAICINQGDLDEKASQVALMRNIYTNCSKTTAWLGPSDKSSQKVFQGIKLKDRVYKGALLALLARPWFRRVWVIQEISYATTITVQCGPDTIEWDDLIKALSTLSELSTIFNLDGAQNDSMLHPVYYPRILDSARKKVVKGDRFSLRSSPQLQSFQCYTDGRQNLRHCRTPRRA